MSELELTLGDVAMAVADAEQSVAHADRSGDAFWRMASRAKVADALHQAGRRPEASERFREAEVLQAEWQPAYPLLYALGGFQACGRRARMTTCRVACSPTLGYAPSRVMPRTRKPISMKRSGSLSVVPCGCISRTCTSTVRGCSATVARSPRRDGSSTRSAITVATGNYATPRKQLDPGAWLDARPGLVRLPALCSEQQLTTTTTWR